MAVMVQSVSQEELDQNAQQEKELEATPDEATEEIQDNVSEEGSEVEDESPVHQIRDSREALEEAFADLSPEQLKEMAMRLTKCVEGFQEMLREEELEQEELQAEATQLNASISKAMQDIHRKDQTSAAAEVGQKAVQAFQNLQRGAAKRAAGLVDKGTGLINAAKERHAEARAARAKQQANRSKRQAANAKRQTKEKKVKEPPKEPQADISGAEKQTGEADSKEVSSPDRAASKVALDNIVLRKAKPVLSTDATVVIEAKVTISDETTHILEVCMADSCEEAAKRFLRDHRQRAWFEEPLIAWLKKAESEATKLPLRVEASLPELRKQHAKDAKAAAA